jgi:lysophospholipase L1-like esterase
VAGGRPLAILAIGSSSTEGIGASSPDNAYPARLAEELTDEGGLAVRVRNAGLGGETADATVTRLKAALATGWPQLVIWQVGTNDALKRVDENRFRATVEAGVEAARAADTPIILLDPQYTQRAAADPLYKDYVEAVEDIGESAHVPVFSRYAEMKRLAATPGAGPAPWLSRDGLHMNDLGYACVAHGLAGMIERAAKATVASANKTELKAPGEAGKHDAPPSRSHSARGSH